MAESGIFRTSIGGFNKADVLKYIDDMQVQAQESMTALQQQLEQAEQRAKMAEEQAEQASSRQTELEASFQQENTRLRLQAEETARKLSSVNQQVKALEALQQTNRQLNQELDAFRRKQQDKTHLEQEMDRLQQTCASSWKDNQRLEKENAGLRVALEKAETQLRELENVSSQQTEEREREWQMQMRDVKARCEELEAANARYLGMVGDVGNFILEIRAMGQRFLETAYKRSSACLDAVSGVVEVLENGLGTCQKEMEAVRQELTDQSSVAGMKLEEWVQALETMGQELPRTDDGGK